MTAVTPELVERALELVHTITVTDAARELGVRREQLVRAGVRSHHGPGRIAAPPRHCDCGNRIVRYNAQRCGQCARAAFVHYRKRWTAETVLQAIRDWNRAYGRPPTAMEWNPALARKKGRPDMAAAHAAEDWPYYSTVIAYFGGWNTAITAAGFQPRSPGATDLR